MSGTKINASAMTPAMAMKRRIGRYSSSWLSIRRPMLFDLEHKPRPRRGQNVLFRGCSIAPSAHEQRGFRLRFDRKKQDFLQLLRTIPNSGNGGSDGARTRDLRRDRPTL